MTPDLFDVLCELARPGSDDLRDGVLSIGDFAPVKVGHEVDWGADPFRHPQWRHRLHSLDFLWPSIRERSVTLVEPLVRDWLVRNPVETPPSDYSWAHHTTAKRSRVLAAVYLQNPSEWLAAGLRLHADVLGDPDFYAEHHNHGISQDISLLVLGTVLKDSHKVELARARAREGSRLKVDAEGMVNEQAPAYQGYVLDLYHQFTMIADACREPIEDAVPNIAAMETALADLLLPDGTLAPIGDTYWEEEPDFKLPPVPQRSSLRVYQSGYVLGRHPDSEVFYALRFGPGRSIHGHDDHTSLFLYAQGQARLIEGGHVGYERSEFREYLRGPRAHNVTILPDETFDHSARTELVSHTQDSFVFQDSPHAGVDRMRTVRLEVDPLRVEIYDTLTARAPRLAHQTWNLPPHSEVRIEPPTASVLFPDGRVMHITQRLDFQSMAVAVGEEAPYRGWYALRRKRIPAPALITTARGECIEFETCIEMA